MNVLGSQKIRQTEEPQITDENIAKKIPHRAPRRISKESPESSKNLKDVIDNNRCIIYIYIYIMIKNASVWVCERVCVCVCVKCLDVGRYRPVNLSTGSTPPTPPPKTVSIRKSGSSRCLVSKRRHISFNIYFSFPPPPPFLRFWFFFSFFLSLTWRSFPFLFYSKLVLTLLSHLSFNLSRSCL